VSDALTIAMVWFGLAMLATLISTWIRIATALSEILVGVVAQAAIGAFIGAAFLGSDEPWIKFLASTGAILLTFLAGAELDPAVFKTKWKEASAVGVAGFILPFLGCTCVTYYVLHWGIQASLLSGVALSTTSVAVVYAVMLESGLNKTNYGKTLLAACFINDLGTVLALGFLFSPFTLKTLIFFLAAIVVFFVMPWITERVFRKFDDKPSEFETKYIMFCLLGMGALAGWAGSEAVLPAYIIGMVLAGTVGKHHSFIRRVRTLTFGFLTPFYFIRAGSFVSIPALMAAPFTFIVLLLAKIASKFIGVYPVTRIYKAPKKEAMYTTLLMSTGLTFGTISALFGLSHKIIDGNQYSFLVATVIASAIVPTLIADAFYMPYYHITNHKNESEKQENIHLTHSPKPSQPET